MEKGDDCKGGGGNTFFLGGEHVSWEGFGFGDGVIFGDLSQGMLDFQAHCHCEEVQTHFKDPNDSTLRSVWSLEVFGQMWPFAKFPMDLFIVSCEALPANFQPGCPALVGK